jgi:hypothetical protein
MKTEAIFGAADTGLHAADMTIAVTAMDGTPVSTVGWTMTEQLVPPGSYEIDVPLCLQTSRIYIYKTLDPSVFYDGMMGVAEWQILSPTVSPGIIMVPAATAPGDLLVLHAKTDYDLIEFTLPTYWATHLADADVQFWFTMVMKNTTKTTPALDVQGTVFDVVLRKCRLALTAAQMNITPGDYFWQAQLRAMEGSPAVLRKHNALEGRAYVKPTFKT